ncbi:NmrA family NAD(P)-binding protein [Rhizobium sp. WW_1]|uniref:SDR family oxidoreductase n=2 Tax=unclassified Rhizobium TaxID=2613769 RepID=UPI001FDFE3EB|nr:NmrA family NAD(P)-binding protein [Rhizobium sp. WW_1]
MDAAYDAALTDFSCWSSFMSVVDLSKPVLVYLANGVQGGAVARAASRHGLKVRALVRNPVHSSSLEEAGVELAQADLFDLGSLVAASQGASGAVIQIPMGAQSDMAAQATHAFNAAKIAGLSSIILKLGSASRPEPCEEPSLVANAMVEDIARQSGMLSAIVRPTMYLDNLLRPHTRADLVENGLFAAPISESQQIAWTSADDCAEATVRLLMAGPAGVGDYRISGPESLSGDALAERIMVGLGRPIVYRARPLDGFEQDMDKAEGRAAGRRLASKFRYLATHRDDADAILAIPYSTIVELGDFFPTSVETWIRDRRQILLGSDIAE